LTTRILAVCAGNICRSPVAAAAIEAAATRAGIDVDVDSAGTGSWCVGQPPHPQAVAAAERVGLRPTGRARMINRADFDRFDVIVVMDRSNLRDVIERAPSLEARAKVRLFRTFDPETESDVVPDPYGGPDEGYDATVTQVVAAASGLIQTLKSARLQDSVSLD
jgi:protein-tyrosine phosphatase